MSTTIAQKMSYAETAERIRSEILPLFGAAIRGEYARYRNPNLKLCWDAIDDFKALNDSHGHLQGDKVLARLGRHLMACVRDTDQAFRYGGEEFLIVMPDTVSEDARIVAERIRERFASLVFDVPSHGDENAAARSLTLSGGIGSYENGMGAVELLESADQALYAAKHRGKDRIETFEPVRNI